MNIEMTRRIARLDERGVALPIALFGLIAVSLLVTSAIMTSSTEVALSQAHQGGTQTLYASEAALEQYVAERHVALPADQRVATGSHSVTIPSGEAYSIAVAELLRENSDQPDGSIVRREIYSLLATRPSGVGRAVGALIEATRTASAVTFDIDSGLTLGMDATITGNATISDGSSSGAACDSASAPAAIRHADDTTVDRQGGAHDIYGAIVEDDRSADELISDLLNGKTIDDLSHLAHIRIGPMFGQPSFSGHPSQTAANLAYRWGCPALLVTGCSAEQANYYPTVVVDANGSTIDLSNYHGQGILVVRNGHAHIRGNFKYGGIIFVEGTLTITGTPVIEGGVISAGDDVVIDPGDEALSSGNSLIRYNKCMIVDAQRGLTIQTLDTSPQTIDTPTFAWFEVIR